MQIMSYFKKKNIWKIKLKISIKYHNISGYATWFTAGGAIRIALRQLWQTWKLRHYDVIDDIVTRKV